jgi:transmembrane sensor
MTDYRQYKPEDFAADTSFRNWKLYQLPDDTAYWEKWLKENPDKENDIRIAVQLLDAVFKVFNHVSDEELQSEMSHLARRAGEMEYSDRPQPSFFGLSNNSLYRMAAAILIALGIGFIVYFQKFGRLSRQQEMLTQTPVNIFRDSVNVKTNHSDRNMAILLQDGSTVLLEPQSTLTYPKTFSASRRKVHLSGKAYFEVTKDTDRPFYVIADKLVVKVVGTSFTIHSNQSDSESKVMVRTGTVSVFSAKIASEGEIGLLKGGILLNPNEQITLTRQLELQKTTIKEAAFAQMSLSKEIYQFKATPIAEVFATLEKSYGIRIRFDSAVMKDCYITASLENEPYLQKLKLICTAIGAEFSLLDTNEIEIVSKGC